MTWAALRAGLQARGLITKATTDSHDVVVDVTGVAHDSRSVQPGQVFVALKGQHSDGAVFARQAVQRGAAATIVSEQVAPGDVAVPWIVVGDARLALAVLAATFYRDPSSEMRVIGVTGTNGKKRRPRTSSPRSSKLLACDRGLLGTVAYGGSARSCARRRGPRPRLPT